MEREEHIVRPYQMDQLIDPESGLVKDWVVSAINELEESTGWRVLVSFLEHYFKESARIKPFVWQAMMIPKSQLGNVSIGKITHNIAYLDGKRCGIGHVLSLLDIIRGGRDIPANFKKMMEDEALEQAEGKNNEHS